ncbi:MAG: hypothetical protein IJA76_05520 [Clostridia bacterium]|nr:hypothetical protein [Clostridia bacterium]MBQ4587608.1 hypothetical protein [Clostridia bacterium]
MKGFTFNETKQLLSDCIEAQSNGASLQAVFERTAIRTKRAKGTVRNFYYSTLKDIERGAFLGQLPDGVERLKAKHPKTFTKEDADALFSKINAQKMGGKSVRQAIIEMSNGDSKLALRYQNKYRSMLKNQSKKAFTRIDLASDDFKYFNKLSQEIDGLVERIKDKYAKECVKLKEENLRLTAQIKKLQKAGKSQVVNFFTVEKENANN